MLINASELTVPVFLLQIPIPSDPCSDATHEVRMVAFGHKQFWSHDCSCCKWPLMAGHCSYNRGRNHKKQHMMTLPPHYLPQMKKLCVLRCHVIEIAVNPLASAKIRHVLLLLRLAGAPPSNSMHFPADFTTSIDSRVARACLVLR